MTLFLPREGVVELLTREATQLTIDVVRVSDNELPIGDPSRIAFRPKGCSP
jgi:hypothetical protein